MMEFVGSGIRSHERVTPAQAGVQGQQATEQAALDTGFRRYDEIRLSVLGNQRRGGMVA
jgi:hypothetical protein